MKIRICFLVAILCFFCLSTVHAQEYGKVRALRQRAADVVNLKNNFVARVLTSYAIPHERNEQGVVVRIHVDGKWLDVNTIDIIPVLTEGKDKNQQVAAHELFFYTPDGILDLVSELTIR